VDQQHALAEGGSCGERLAAHESGREAPWEGGGEIAIVACLCFVEETNLVLLVDLVEGDTWLRLAWWAGMGLLGLVGWELIHVSTELICVQYRLVKVRMASPRRLGGWKGVERLASPRLVALKTMRQTFA
jgi:hypothetical protein